MKKIKILVAAILTLGLSSGIYAQQSQTQVQTQTTGAPQSFKYQAVARNVNGDAIANQPVSFRITILQGSAEGTSVYQETQTATTNQFGLANLSIGNGIVVSGTFNTIDWSTGSYFIKTEFDPKGGENYTVMGTSQMLSVPYSLYAGHAMMADSVKEFPIKVALQGTNLQAPFDNPQTGMLVYNTDSAGIGIYSVIPGYYYNAGTATNPNWLFLSTSGNSGYRKKPLNVIANNTNTTYGGMAQDNINTNGSTIGMEFLILAEVIIPDLEQMFLAEMVLQIQRGQIIVPLGYLQCIIIPEVLTLQ